MVARRPADYVTAKRTAQEFERIWDRIEASGPRRRSRLRRVWAAALVPAVVAAAAMLWMREPAPSDPPNLAAEPTLSAGDWFATDGDRRIVQLGRGGWLELGRDSRARIASVDEDAIHVDLERGAVLCNMPPGDKALELRTHAPAVSMRGTRFKATLESEGDDPVLSVEVGEGTVEILFDGVTATVTESWTSRPEVAPAEVASARRDAPQERVPTPAPRTGRPSAKSLWVRAGDARRAGAPAQAATLYAELVRSHPDDARAGLAALELARIRLDSLDDAAGAVEAFDFAIIHGGEAFFSEDAQAGRVEALSRSGNADGCRRARDAFLADNPKSAHAPRVATMCRE